jgi:hypothetical protein
MGCLHEYRLIESAHESGPVVESCNRLARVHKLDVDVPIGGVG